MLQVVEGLFLRLIGGLCELLPRCSTGHLLLLGPFLGFESAGKTLAVPIQLGGIVASLLAYYGRLWGIAKALPYKPEARRFVIGVLVAFLPAALIGAVLHGFIKDV